MSIPLKLRKYVSNLPGWRTGRKLMIIESDDWGSVRMPNRESRDKLSKKGIIAESNRYNRYDTLATVNDLSSLFDVLKKYKDRNGKTAVMTPVAIVANPDFKKIKESGFEKYYYESFTDTLNRYYGNSNKVMEAWKEGSSADLFTPQFHGREHLNVQEWMRALRSGDEITNIAFEHGIWGFELQKAGNMRVDSFLAPFDLPEQANLDYQAKSIIDGLDIFENLFGYRASFFVPPNGPFNNSLEKTAAECGIKYMSKAKRQIEPLGNGKTQIVYHTPGNRNEYGQLYLTRNCIFEPSEEGKDWVDSCLSDINIAFRMRKPAVISTHRVNYIGAIEESNRTRGLLQLDQLLQRVVKNWPEVEFITSDQLGDIVTKDKYSSG